MANRNRKKLKIHWEPPDEYIDLIPYEWFGHDVVDEDKCYSITWPCGRPATQARCKISVSGSQATLYYGGSNKNYNDRRDISIGTTRVTFHDKSRSGVHKVEWEDEQNLIRFLHVFYKIYISYFQYKSDRRILVGNRRNRWTKAARTRKVRTIPRADFFVYRTNKAVARGADHGRNADRCGEHPVVR